MMLEKLGGVAPAASMAPGGQSQALLQRMQTALEESPTKPPPEDPFAHLTPEERKAITDEMIKNQWTTDFMLAMIMGDEEKLGPQPDQD